MTEPERPRPEAASGDGEALPSDPCENCGDRHDRHSAADLGHCRSVLTSESGAVERVAEALRKHPDKTHTVYEQADAVLDALGLEQVGWYNVFVGPNGNPGDRVEVGVQSFHPTEAGWESEPVYRLAASGSRPQGGAT